MTINYSSELMKNQKQAVVMAPDPQFEVLQTQEGNSLFFSIGTDNVFYCTREVPSNTQGWTKTDLSTALSSNFNGAAVTAKDFRLFQNISAGTIDMALVITVNGNDYLYLSLGNADDDASWAATPAWTAVPYDDTANPVSPLTVTDLYIASSAGVEYIMVDRLTDPSNPLNLITRYYIDPTKTITGQVWNQHSLPANISAGTVSNCIGRKTGQQVDGIYTMGQIVNTPELFYTPLYNPFSPGNAPSPTYFTLPAGATAMAVSYNSSGSTDLYVAASGSLYFLESSLQNNLATPVQVYTHALLANVQKLFVNNANSQTIVWGLNQQNQVFYLKVMQGSETELSAWSCPIPIVSNAMGVSTFVNTAGNNSVIFAHIQDPVAGDELKQLSQDPVTSNWQSRYVVLPATDVNDIIESHTYTTRIQLQGDNNLTLPGMSASITATSPCSVYINNQYCTLSDSVALNVTSDSSGIITIMQEINSLGSVCYTVQCSQEQVSINPMSVPISRLQGTVNLNVNVTDERGNSQPLVSSGVSSSDQAAVAQAITQFVQVSATMPQDGSIDGGSTALARKAIGLAASSPFGLDFSSGAIVAYAGGATENAIEAAAGDIWRWIKDAVEDVDNFFVQVIGDVTHFFISIGEAIYHFTLKCVSDVMHGIDFVLRKIGLGLEDMIKWIGFIFNWADIVLTHKVLRNVMLQYVNQCVNQLSETATAVQKAFQDLETNINNWAGIPNVSTTYASASASYSLPPGSNSPQAHWGVYHTQNNVLNASANLPDATTPDPGVTSVLQDLLNAIATEKESMAWVFDEVSALVQDLPTLTLTEAITRFIAILTDELLTTTENIITTLLNVFASLVEGFIDTLTATINIPVISHLYKKFAGEDLSLFDLVVLVASIPVTVIFKVVTNAAPFDDDDVTNSIINAPDFATIQQICAQNSNAIPVQAAADVMPSLSMNRYKAPQLSSLFDKLSFAGNILGSVGALVQAVLTPLKVKFPENYILNSATAIFYVPYVAPDIIGSLKELTQGKWYVVLNELCCLIGTVKAVADAVFCKKAGFGTTWLPISPWADFALNVFWQVPTTAAPLYPENNNTAAFFQFMGGTMFDISGILSPMLALDDEPVTVAIFAVLISACNVEYGAAVLLSSFV